MKKKIPTNLPSEFFEIENAYTPFCNREEATFVKESYWNGKPKIIESVIDGSYINTKDDIHHSKAVIMAKQEFDKKGNLVCEIERLENFEDARNSIGIPVSLESSPSKVERYFENNTLTDENNFSKNNVNYSHFETNYDKKEKIFATTVTEYNISINENGEKSVTKNVSLIQSNRLNEYETMPKKDYFENYTILEPKEITNVKSEKFNVDISKLIENKIDFTPENIEKYCDFDLSKTEKFEKTSDYSFDYEKTDFDNKERISGFSNKNLDSISIQTFSKDIEILSEDAYNNAEKENDELEKIDNDTDSTEI